MASSLRMQVATYVINLDRGQERLSSVSNLLKMLELDFTRVPAVNGRELLLRGGRARCKSKFVWRLTYTEGKDRVTHLVRPGKLASCGAVDFWAQHGRARSHFNALKSLVAHTGIHWCWKTMSFCLLGLTAVRFGSGCHRYAAI